MKVFLFLILLQSTIVSFAQKKALDYSVQYTWPEIGGQNISNDGKYILFSISSKIKGSTLYLKAVDNSWEMEMFHAGRAVFTEDSKRVIFMISRDSIGILKLGTSEVKIIPNVISFNTPKAGEGKWMGYQVKDQEKSMYLRNLISGTERKFSNVNDYVFSKDGNSLVLLEEFGTDSMSSVSLTWVDLKEGKASTFWHGFKASNFVFDDGGLQLSFVAEKNSNGQSISVLEYYKFGMDSAKILVDHSTPGMEKMSVSKINSSFSKDGNTILFYICESVQLNISQSRDTLAQVIVWSYQDDVLKENLPSQVYRRNYATAYNLNITNKIIRLEQNDNDYIISTNLNENYGKYVLVNGDSKGNQSEYKWRPSARPNIYLVSILNGSRTLLKNRIIDTHFELSVAGNYVVWYDRETKNWFSYNITRHVETNITAQIKCPLYRDYDYPGYKHGEGIAGWLEEDKAVLIYDRYDIWQVDPDGVKAPINITHEYGKRNNIRLRYLDFNGPHRVSIGAHETLLLSAFNLSTKFNGFCEVQLGDNGKMNKYSMYPMTYFFYYRYTPAYSSETDPIFPIKAKYAHTYLFKRMSAIEYPNLYVTNDFIDFRSITNLSPQKEYNWYTSELIHWKLPNGRLGEGILYKPENFNPKKKYPIIFYIYERMSDALNAFIGPRLSRGTLNIPWFVSNGYLVFVPDIHYKIGHTGESACNSVVTAAIYLSQKPWVDVHRLGLQGHSFGGFETDYIVTRTRLFAAAAPASGLCDLVTDYGQLRNNSGSQEYYEVRQGRIAKTLWERPDLYIRNSPIFKANNVTTPLLILHNKLDNTVSITQDIEWFTALRRLGKKAWMLQYVDENHQILGEKNQLDYSVRLGQFFNHYLKGADAPKWMDGD